MNETRLFKILYHLIDKGQATAPDLAKRFEVSVRTIYRDIDALSSAGIPIYASAGRNGGISLTHTNIMRNVYLSDKEKEEVLIALQQMMVLPDTTYTNIATKLQALFKTSIPAWIEIDFSQWGEFHNIEETFNQLKSAILEHRVIHFYYANASGEVKARTVKPLKLIFQSSSWYLQAFSIEQNAFRTFKILRMQHITLTDATFEELIPPSHKTYVSSNHVRLTLRFHKNIAYRVYDEFSFDCITKESDESLLVHVDMPEEKWLVLYLLSFGKNIEIIEPLHIRKAFLEEITAMQTLYNKS